MYMKNPDRFVKCLSILCFVFLVVTHYSPVQVSDGQQKLINSIHCLFVFFLIFFLYLYCSYFVFVFVAHRSLVWPSLVCLMAKDAFQFHPFFVFLLLLFCLCICDSLQSGLSDGRKCFSAPIILYLYLSYFLFVFVVF